MKKFEIFDQYLVLYRKQYRYGHSYNGRRLWTQKRSIEWYHLQWSWV